MNDETKIVAASQPSVVALIDVLGFKSIELRGSVAEATMALMSARQTIRELTKWMGEKVWAHVHTLGGPPRVRVSWFSNTICFVAQAPEKQDLRRLLVRVAMELRRFDLVLTFLATALGVSLIVTLWDSQDVFALFQSGPRKVDQFRIQSLVQPVVLWNGTTPSHARGNSWIASPPLK